MKRFASWVFLLTAIAMQLQGALLLPKQLAKPMHFHRPAGAEQAPTTGSLSAWFVDLVSRPHEHGPTSHHHHELQDSTVIYVETDNAAPGVADTPRHTGLDPYWAILPPAPDLNLARADDKTDPSQPGQRPSISATAAERPPRA